MTAKPKLEYWYKKILLLKLKFYSETEVVIFSEVQGWQGLGAARKHVQNPGHNTKHKIPNDTKHKTQLNTKHKTQVICNTKHKTQLDTK